MGKTAVNSDYNITQVCPMAPCLQTAPFLYHEVKTMFNVDQLTEFSIYLVTVDHTLGRPNWLILTFTIILLKKKKNAWALLKFFSFPNLYVAQ